MQLFKGIEWRGTLTAVDADGAAVDLTGKTIALTLKRRSTEAALVTLTVGDGITLQAQSGATLGKADLVIAAGDSVAWESAKHQLAVIIDDQVAMEPTKISVRDV